MGLIQDKPKVALAGALVVALGLTGGAVAVFLNAGNDGTTVATNPTITASPSASPTPEPTTEPTAEASATATPTASASATTTPTASASASPTASATGTFPYAKPSKTYDGLVLTSTISNSSGTTATTFRMTQLKATDGDGTIYFDSILWGDGTSTAGTGSPQKCKTYPPLTAPAPAYQPQPDSYLSSNQYSHRYKSPGTYRIVVKVSSVNVDCRPNGPKTESSVNIFPPVLVTAAPSPSPSASPTASPTPSPTATPMPSPSPSAS